MTEITGELVDAEEAAEHHPDAVGEHVWAGWRGGDAGRTHGRRERSRANRRGSGMVAADDRGAAAARSAARSRERRRTLREQVDETLP
ncbi:hypothetical protein [Rhizobium redzepovicii]|nr:hypothetical protein [Rhizobium sp. BK456]